MSVDVTLERDDEIVLVPNHCEDGAIYALGGTDKAELVITYNYSDLYRLVIPEYPGMVALFDGKRAGDLIPILETAVEKLSDKPYKRHRDGQGSQFSPLDPRYADSMFWDYWAPTPGNAGHALNILLGWARLHPDAVFRAEG